MQSLLPTNTFCSTFGHNYFRVEKLNEKNSEVICKCCEKKFLTTNQGDIIEHTFKNNDLAIFIDYLDYQENRLRKKSA